MKIIEARTPHLAALQKSSLDILRQEIAEKGPANLGIEELLALIFRSREEGFRVGAILLQRFEGIRGIGKASYRELVAVPGVGFARAVTLLATLELGKRLVEERLRPGQRIRSAGDVFRHFKLRLQDLNQECFHVILLDGRHAVIRDLLVSKGTLTASLVHPREVFGQALRESAAAVILVHNHPSGDPSPSAEDREITGRLVRSGVLLGVRVLDHVIVSCSGYTSFCEQGWMPSEEDGFFS